MELFLLRLILAIYFGIFCVLTTTEGTHANVSMEFLGCYADSQTRAFTGASKSFGGNMTRELCADYCHRKGFRYAGLQVEHHCFCGNSGYDKYGRSHGCSLPCAGNPRQICGGRWHNAVYRIGTESTTISTGFQTAPGAGEQILNGTKSTTISTNLLTTSGAGEQTFNRRLIGIITALAFVSLMAIVAVSLLIAKRKEIFSTPVSFKMKSPEAGHQTSPQETGQRIDKDNSYMNLQKSRPSHIYASGHPVEEHDEYDYAQCDTPYVNHSGKGMYVTDLRLEAPDLLEIN